MGVVLEWETDLNLSPFSFDPEGIYRCLLTTATNALDSFKEQSLMTEEGDPIERVSKEKSDGLFL